MKTRLNRALLILLLHVLPLSQDEPTRYKYSAYYVIAFLENTALIVLWYFRADPVLWYRLPLLIGVISSFAVGITFMLIYYRFFHPNGRLPLYNPIARCC